MIRSDIAFLPERAQMGEMSRALIEPASPSRPIHFTEGGVGRPHAEWLASVRDAGITILFTHLYVTGQNKHGAQTDVTISIRCVAYPACPRKEKLLGEVVLKIEVWAGAAVEQWERWILSPLARDISTQVVKEGRALSRVT